LSAKYWCSTRSEIIEQITENNQDEMPKTLEKPIEEIKQNTAQIEKEKIIRLEKEKIQSDGIRILGIDKTFHIGTCKKRSLHALKEIYMEIETGEMLALLGHNGAGKSTLINILTGILSCNKGTAKIFGYDLNQNIVQIQKMIGLVPQFDILWGELTASEHLWLFAQLKGIPREKIPELIKQKLQEVNLEKQENSLVKTFSGGMKRRLSVAIGGIGNPKIIIMDEPTTGMDPVNKRSVWKLIRVFFF